MMNGMNTVHIVWMGLYKRTRIYGVMLCIWRSGGVLILGWDGYIYIQLGLAIKAHCIHKVKVPASKKLSSDSELQFPS